MGGTLTFLGIESSCDDTAAAVVLDGVNHDDLGDHRPGIRAAQERQVISPLAELGISKAGVRARALAARSRGLVCRMLCTLSHRLRSMSATCSPG